MNLAQFTVETVAVNSTFSMWSASQRISGHTKLWTNHPSKSRFTQKMEA